MAGHITNPAPLLWWELGKHPEGLTLITAFRNWAHAEKGLQNAHNAMCETKYHGERVEGSYAWRLAGSLTGSEYRRWEKASLAYMAIMATPHLPHEHREVLAYIRQELRPNRQRKPKGKRKSAQAA